MAEENKGLLEGVLKKYLEKTLNLTDDEVASLYEDEEKTKVNPKALKILEDKHEEKIKGIKDENAELLTKKFDDGEKKGRKTALTAWEKQVKEEFKIETSAVGVDLVKEIVSKNSEGEIDDEKVKLHPLFIEKEKSTVPKEEHEKVMKEFDEYKQSKESKEIGEKIGKATKKQLLEMGVVLSKDKVKAENQVNNFVELVNREKWQLENDGNHILMDGDKRAETKHGVVITFNGYIKEKAESLFDFEKQPDRQNLNEKNKDKKEIVVDTPKNEKEYNEAIANAKSAEERVKIHDAYYKK